MKRSIRKWTKQNCAQVASDCRSRTEFQQRFKGAYVRASEEGWIDELFPISDAQRKPSGYWSYDRVREHAARCSSIKEFRARYSGAYDRAVKMGWLGDISRHMVRSINPRGTWTIEACAELAKEYTLRSHFRRVCPVAYQAAHANGWIDEICAHMDRGGSSKDRALYVISNEQSKEVYVGLSWDPYDRYSAHKRDPKSSAYALTQGPHDFQILSDFLPKAEASKAEASLLEEYEANGWAVLNKAKAGSLGGTLKWTKRRVAKLAKGFTSRAHFQKAHPGAYKTALREAYADEVFAHMDVLRKVYNWTEQEVEELVSAYRNISSLEKAHPSAAAYLRRRNLVDVYYPDRRKAYTFEDARKVAANFETAAKLHKGNRSAYIAFRRMGWLSQLYPDWLPNGKVKIEEAGGIKRCSQCQRDLPATTEHFHKNEGGLYGVKSICIECHKSYMRKRNRRAKGID